MNFFVRVWLECFCVDLAASLPVSPSQTQPPISSTFSMGVCQFFGGARGSFEKERDVVAVQSCD